MNIGIPKELYEGETRIPVIPSSVERLVKLGATCLIEYGLGSTLGFSDSDYEKQGAILKSRLDILSSSDLILRVRQPAVAEIGKLKKGSIHVSFLDPFHEIETVKAMAKNNISAISMEMIPRTTLAQKMDAISSQANLAGYVAVIIAAEKSFKILPMMMTPAGTIAPSRIFIIGAGVAGLQAIATAKRLGARVEAFDTRPVVEEQVNSLGAKFIKIDLGETGQTKDGYAKALTSEQLEKQRLGMAKVCSHSDIIITTAQVFGKKAPIIITKEMLKNMAPGTIIIDMAVDSGGNVEGSKINEEININGIRIIGFSNLPGRVPIHASQMYSNNLVNLINSYWETESKIFKIDPTDDFFKACLITHEGQIINESIKELF